MDKKLGRKSVDVDEESKDQLEEHVLGFSDLNALNRIKELAGVTIDEPVNEEEDDTEEENVEETVEDTDKKEEIEENILEDALTYLVQSFDRYQSLNEQDRKEFRSKMFSFMVEKDSN